MTEHPNLHLSPEERQLFGRVFSAADTDGLGVITGETALRFFPERTKLPPEILGKAWQIADTENNGFLTPPGFSIVLRLIGYAQGGRSVSEELALKPGGPLPRFEGINGPATIASNVAQGPLQAQNSGGPIRVPPLTAEMAHQFAALFEEAGAQNGLLFGGTAKQIFDRAQLPNEILLRIWKLADTEQRGLLNATEFIIAMHLLTSYKARALSAIPQTLPTGLYEAAARRGALPRPVSGSRSTPDLPPASAVPRQFSGAGPQRTSSPLTRPPYAVPAPPTPQASSSMQPSMTWVISPQEKLQFDKLFADVDAKGRGYITGDQAVTFFSNSKLPEDDLAQIWDLTDINSEGQLSRDEFAVAMYLIRQQVNKRGTLPSSLPANLVPPSMRRQPVAPSQSTAPIFDNAANMTKSKSAAEDLFGLDAFSTPATQIPQSTGGSVGQFSVSPHPTGSPLQPQHTQPSTVFKPFVPSSSFGQNMMTPQATGATSSTAPSELSAAPISQNRGFQQQRQPSNMDDLLGDNDPDISKRLTQETTELANLSNQVGTLTNQMQEVKSQRASTEQGLSQVNTQKRDFETRLSQLRSAYEQEVRDVKALEERLTASRQETKKAQEDLAMVHHTYQNLREQHQQILAALETDQGENASLKERMREVNAEIGQLKPQIEKMRSDARQQKGLVAINKKQLSTIEAERDRAKSDLESSTRDLSEATSELEESKRSLEAAESRRSFEAASQTRLPPSGVASPAPSAAGQSMNPFFRRTTTTSSERGMSQSPFAPQAVASPNHNAFDSFFGPSFETAASKEAEEQSSAAPPTSFGGESQSLSDPRQTLHSVMGQSEVANDPPAADAPSSFQDDLPPSNALPPPPPQSRQITSSFLPLRDNRDSPSSPSSSVGVAAPTSRFGDVSGLATPVNERQISQAFHQSDARDALSKSDLDQMHVGEEGPGSPFPERKSSLPGDTDPHRPAAIGTAEANSGFRDLTQPSAPPDIPGAFPSGSTPFHTPLSSSGQLDESSRHPDTPFHNDNINLNPSIDSGSEIKTPSSAKDDFDSAFAGFGGNGKATENSERAIGDSKAQPATHSEFPPIQELGADDSSESESDRGFEDNFSPTTPQRPLANPLTGQKPMSSGGGEHLIPLGERPELDRAASNTSQLPTPNAQQSPPTYDSTVYPNGHTGGHRDSNQFPAEYGGLLPAREDPTSASAVASPASETAVRSPSNGDASNSFFGSMTSRDRVLSGTSLPAAQMPMAPGATAAPFAYDNSQALAQAPSSQAHPSVPPKSAYDDFDDEFGDLAEAQAADDKGEDDFASSFSRDGFDEFNPAFDSPAPSKATASSILQNDAAFHDFESSIQGSSSSFAPTQGSKLVPHPTTSPDWDAIFAGLHGSSTGAQPNGNGGGMAPQPVLPPKEILPTELLAAAAAPVMPAAPSKPTLGRALTAGTEHDDPILKRLTGMGYPRDESLSALERFDYNLDKAADYLTSRG